MALPPACWQAYRGSPRGYRRMVDPAAGQLRQALMRLSPDGGPSRRAGAAARGKPVRLSPDGGPSRRASARRGKPTRLSPDGGPSRRSAAKGGAAHGGYRRMVDPAAGYAKLRQAHAAIAGWWTQPQGKRKGGQASTRLSPDVLLGQTSQLLENPPRRSPVGPNKFEHLPGHAEEVHLHTLKK